MQSHCGPGKLTSTPVQSAKRLSTNHASTVRLTKSPVKSALYLGARAITPSTSTVSTGGSKQEVSVLWTTKNGTMLGTVVNES